MTTPQHVPAQTQNDIGPGQAGPERSWASGLASLSGTIALGVATTLSGARRRPSRPAGRRARAGLTKAGVELADT